MSGPASQSVFAALQPNVLWALAVMFLALTAGSAIRIAMQFATARDADTDADKHRSNTSSLKTWWVLSILFAAAVLLGPFMALLLFAVASVLGLREFFALNAPATNNSVPSRMAFLAVPIYYAVLAWNGASLVWPMVVLMLLLIPATSAALGRTTGFVRDVAVTSWGILLLLVCLSHVPMLLLLPPECNSVGGSTGWFVYLVLLTQVNDINQALWGRQFGRHKVTPRVSPNKTWEGLLLGLGTTVALAVVLSIFMTPLAAGEALRWGKPTGLVRFLPAIGAGLLIGIGGFLGDISMSAVKRDAGVKDSGTLMPGQGGVLDRVDSMTFTGPLFYYSVYWLYVSR